MQYIIVCLQGLIGNFSDHVFESPHRSTLHNLDYIEGTLPCLPPKGLLGWWGWWVLQLPGHAVAEYVVLLVPCCSGKGPTCQPPLQSGLR